MFTSKFYKIAKNQLFPLCRSITGKDLIKSLKIIANETNIVKIKHIKSGSKIYDWKIPEEWNISEAYIIDENNQKIIDFKNNNLHIVNYSKPLKKILNKSELLKKIYTHSKLKNAIPYRTTYYKKDWGFCLSSNEKQKIRKKYNENSKFKVIIKTKFKKKGKLSYGEGVIRGKLKKEFIISTNICHPSMANNELSGPIVSMSLINYLKSINSNYTFRFLFLPETIGSIGYINKNFRNLKKNCLGIICLTCIGNNVNYFTKISSKYSNSILDEIIETVAIKNKIKLKKVSFLKRGSDERQFNSPHINIPTTTLCKSKFGEYPEYHTSADNFAIMRHNSIKNSYKFLKKILNELDKQIIPISKIPCEPFMSKRNLRNSLGGENHKDLDMLNLMHFLQYSDGSNTINKISKLIKTDIKKSYKIYKMLNNAKLLT